jgi:hypothetical protein
MAEIKKKLPAVLQLLSDVVDGTPGTIGEISSASLRVNTAEKWLDRAGYPAQKPGVNMHLHGHFNAQDIEDIKKRAMESGQVVDI